MFDCEMKRDSAERVTVKIRGSLVLGSPTDRLRECLRTLTDRYPAIRIDATELKFMDSSGLGELVLARAEAKALGGEVELVGATKNIRDLLVLTKLVTVFGVSTKPQADVPYDIQSQ
jgi:anti-sigma B factor antagonist